MITDSFQRIALVEENKMSTLLRKMKEDGIQFGEWGVEPLSSPSVTLTEYGFIPLGSIHDMWRTGLSYSVLKKLSMNPTVEYKHYSAMGEQYFDTARAYRIADMVRVINEVYATAKKVSNRYFESPMIDSKFELKIAPKSLPVGSGISHRLEMGLLILNQEENKINTNIDIIINPVENGLITEEEHDEIMAEYHESLRNDIVVEMKKSGIAL